MAAPDFYGMLSGMGDTISQNRSRNDLTQTLASLGPNPDYNAAAMKLLPTNPGAAMTLAQLGNNSRDFQFRVSESQRDQTNKDRDFGKPQIVGNAETGYYMVPRNGIPGTTPLGQPGQGGMQPIIPGKPSVLNREQQKEYAARVSGFNKDAEAARGLQGDVAQMRALRDGVSYEGGWFPDARTTIGRTLNMNSGMLGIPSGQEAGNAEALRSKSVDIQLGFSEKTKGAITDREQSMFAGATPGLYMSDTGAKQVLDGQEAGAARVIEKSKFYQTYVQKHNGLAGADQAWDRFIKDKPIFSRGKDGQLAVNRDNIGGWENYVGEGDSPAQNPGASMKGRTATNPQTGAKMVHDGNGWVPAR